MGIETKLPHSSSLGFKYPEHRDDPMHTMDSWLQDKRADDGAEGLWRIHNKLYDLTDFISSHPGGSDWLKYTEGTDITEAFESHHISTVAEMLLPKYFIREAKHTRNSPFTFNETGFYRTLKGRIREALKDVPQKAENNSKYLTDALLIGYICACLAAALLNSFALGVAGGILLALLTISAHNFFHQKDNFRMYYFDFSFLSSREWRISHALSHHMYTNTIIDLEIASPEPFLCYLPEDQHIIRRIISIIISPGFYVFVFPMTIIFRIISSFKNRITRVSKADVLPFLLLLYMYLVGSIAGKSFLETLAIWFFIIIVGSFHFGVVGVNAAHHHPKIFHDGDAVRDDLDWGLFQLDAVMDRKEITGSHFLVLTNFGDHTMHHLFPTIDHGKLIYLYPTLLETCKEFDVQVRMTTQLKLVIGQFRQLLKTKPNPFPPITNIKTITKS